MQIQHNLSLKTFNSFGIDVTANFFSTFSNIDGIGNILDNNKLPLLILGGGSNILFTNNYNGLVLKNEMEGIDILKEDEHHVFLKVGAGVSWHAFVLYCIEHDFAGVENLSLIPGNVGASPMQNIGAYGVELKDVFYSLDAYHIRDRKIISFTNKECQFGYRESVFKNEYKGQFIITAVTFKLNKIPVFNTSYGALEQALEKMGVQNLSIKSISDAVISIRQSKLPDPKKIGNAGSFFKNPTVSNQQFAILKNEFSNIVGYAIGESETKLAAGWLIEQCGWKGYRKGDVGCHEKQALVLVNYGDARGEEVLNLSEEIIESVKLKFDVLLLKEVNIY